MPKEHLNPDKLTKNPAFSQVVVVESSARTVYVAGQNAVDTDGAMVGSTLAEQTTKALENLIEALTAAGASLSDIVKWTILIVEGQSVGDGFAAFQRVWDGAGEPPAITVAFVSALALPDALVEIDAVAVVD